jgi:hypothetical protein
VGGPRKDATLCEEYTLRSVRMDPTLSVLSKSSLGNLEIRTSRHAVGRAAALLATQTLPITTTTTTTTTNDIDLDVVVSSLVGSDAVPLETWQAEWARVEEMEQSGGQGGAQVVVFSASFSSVPDVERLANWLATKWAPAVLRTYDIAAIRRGARPVYASRTGDEGRVEIVWQQLDDESQAVIEAGKLIIQVNNDGLVATRAVGGDASSQGFGSVSRKAALPGETVLVRRLADAASQAIEKGLANKVSSETNTRKPNRSYVYMCISKYACMY